MKIIKRRGTCCTVAGRACSSIKGERLSAALNRSIDSMATGDTTRGDIIDRMGNAAGISSSTVSQILNGSIVCPPLARLRSFARVLNIGLSAMTTAATGDGCDYSGSDDS